MSIHSIWVWKLVSDIEGETQTENRPLRKIFGAKSDEVL
jgi:hypothetical protein